MAKSILYVTPYFPDLIRVRPFNFIRFLSERDHKITLLTLGGDAAGTNYEDISKYCQQVISVSHDPLRSFRNCVGVLPSKIPLQAAYAWNPKLLSKFERTYPNSTWVDQFDVVHVEHLRGVRYALELSKAMHDLKKRIPIVWDSVDCISALFEQTADWATKPLNRWIAKFELPRTRRYENWLVPQFDRVLVTSTDDRQALLSLSNEGIDPSKVEIISNGVDLNYFHPFPPDMRKNKDLIMTGKMSYHANVTMCTDFVENIFPRVLEHNAEVQLWIVGKDPPHLIRSMEAHPNIHVTGTVKDIRPHLGGATLAVVPLKYGVGIQNKVLEAFAMETPVISTSIAASALTAKNGIELVIADEPAAFASSIHELLDDPERRIELGKAGRRYVEQHHDWNRITDQLEAIYEDVINR